jgi:hypothetical protein
LLLISGNIVCLLSLKVGRLYYVVIVKSTMKYN